MSRFDLRNKFHTPFFCFAHRVLYNYLCWSIFFWFIWSRPKINKCARRKYSLRKIIFLLVFPCDQYRWFQSEYFCIFGVCSLPVLYNDSWKKVYLHFDEVISGEHGRSIVPLAWHDRCQRLVVVTMLASQFLDHHQLVGIVCTIMNCRTTGLVRPKRLIERSRASIIVFFRSRNVKHQRMNQTCLSHVVYDHLL